MTLRDDLFNAIFDLVKTCSKLRGEDGTVRVYDYPQTAPAGYPYAVVSSSAMESDVLDNTSDVRKYGFRIQVVGEKFGSEGAMTQSEALNTMRTTEDAIMTLLDANFFLGRQDIVIRTMPYRSEIGVNSDNGARVVLTIDVRVDTRITINTN